ncbi:uncharacterized protein EDB91DRAFT_1242350 [Suillus paluster]|uniref:uncharacterized protein n=1 Tax=Suillus paluster TaxID=48578 RepID=UPI001B8601FE|nr:uncharacterized protein EDB91DRAFT_1242350 [Suillus paluster]KAG1755141.1 hypothetical protein EDB91DRAFT_1242350 [Suillus paluster]
MSSPLTFNYHRRSHSASSPSPSPVPKALWPPAGKRARSSCNSPALPDSASSQTRNFDLWRTGKRLRRDVSVRADNIAGAYPRVTNYHLYFQPPSVTYTTGSSTPVSTDSHSSGLSSSAPHTPLFAATPADFLLFSGRSSRREIAFEKSRIESTNPIDVRDTHSSISEADATRLRSDAFWELRRSIAVSGENLVKRMQPLTDEEPRSGIPLVSPLPDLSEGLAALRATRRMSKYTLESSVVFPPSRQKRASSLGSTDIDTDEMLASSFSKYLDQASIRSSLSNDDAGDLSRHSFNTTFSPDTLHSTSSSPAYKYSAYTTAFSPALSGPSISSPARSFEEPRSGPTIHNSIFPSYHPTAASLASRTEKAIAALSLAIANGAAGLGDYEDLHDLDVPSVMMDSQAGELWH